MKCIIKDCEGGAIVRGLCLKCLNEAREYIESGQTTWPELVSNGLALEKHDKAFVSAMKLALPKMVILQSQQLDQETE
jgi:hypothetical protein